MISESLTYEEYFDRGITFSDRANVQKDDEEFVQYSMRQKRDRSFAAKNFKAAARLAEPETMKRGVAIYSWAQHVESYNDDDYLKQRLAFEEARDIFTSHDRKDATAAALGEIAKWWMFQGRERDRPEFIETGKTLALKAADMMPPDQMPEFKGDMETLIERYAS